MEYTMEYTTYGIPEAVLSYFSTGCQSSETAARQYGMGLNHPSLAVAWPRNLIDRSYLFLDTSNTVQPCSN